MSNRLHTFNAAAFALTAVVMSGVAANNSLNTNAQVIRNSHIVYNDMVVQNFASPTAQVPDELDGFTEKTKPTFFRSGKTLDQNIIEESTEDPLDVFDLEPEPDVVEEVVEPQVAEPVVEEVVEPQVAEPVVEEVVDEPIKEAAQQQFTIMSLLGKSRYYVSGLAVIFALGMFFVIKKKPAVTGMPDNVPAQTITAPEESSPRLEQALKAMEKEGIHAAGDRLKEVSDDTVAFTEPPENNPDQ